METIWEDGVARQKQSGLFGHYLEQNSCRRAIWTTLDVMSMGNKPCGKQLKFGGGLLQKPVLITLVNM